MLRPLHSALKGRDQYHAQMENKCKLSESTLALLAPLPPFLSFARDKPGKRIRQSRFTLASPVKRQKCTTSDNSLATGLPSDIAAAIDAIRRDGAAADTLFFPSVPAELREETALRAAIATPLRELKILPQTRPGGKVLGWAAFFNEADCVSVLCSLREKVPGLKPRLHKPKASVGASEPGNAATFVTSSYGEVFKTRADKVLSEGGLADTLMLRGLPLDVSQDEICEMMRTLEDASPALRTRTCEGSNGKVRNFWITFASRQDAGRTFLALMGHQVSFRCGKSMRIVPLVHNDSKDAESKKRRMREQAMRVHASEGGRDRSNCMVEVLPQSVPQSESTPATFDSRESSKRLDRLADLLKSQSHSFSFV
jgi:hypothetical protein